MIFQFGTIQNPFEKVAPNTTLSALGGLNATSGEGLILIANSIFKLTVVLAGLYTFWNLIIAGYGFMSAGEDAKAIGKAWAKIWQSLLGLLVVSGSLVLAMIFGWLIFGDVTMLISPRVFGP